MQDNAEPWPKAMRLAEALNAATNILRHAGLEAPRREARLVAAHILGLPPTAWPDPDLPIDGPAFAAAIHRRAAHEPMAFITGRQGFWTLDLAVSPATLIPRPDSESLIEAANAACKGAPPARILDLGTGTGCLLLAALTRFPQAFGVGVDLSPEAASLARRNAAANGLQARTAFLAGHWAAALNARFGLVLCNPPYIETAALACLMPEVRRHEPATALDGGPDGLDAYRRLLPMLPNLLTPTGTAVVELGAGQHHAVLALAESAGLLHATTRADLGGHPRAMVLHRAAKKPFGTHAVAR